MTKLKLLEKGLVEDCLQSSLITLEDGIPRLQRDEVMKKIDKKEFAVSCSIKEVGKVLFGFLTDSNKSRAGIEIDNEDTTFLCLKTQDSLLFRGKSIKGALDVGDDITDLFLSGSCVLEDLKIYRSPYIRIYGLPANRRIEWTINGKVVEDMTDWGGMAEIFCEKVSNNYTLVVYQEDGNVLYTFSGTDIIIGSVYSYKTQKIVIEGFKQDKANLTRHYNTIKVKNTVNENVLYSITAETEPYAEVRFNNELVYANTLSPFEEEEIRMTVAIKIPPGQIVRKRGIQYTIIIS